MMLAQSYARALYCLVSRDAGKGGEYLKNLSASLARRGHGKLLPRIFSEYQALELRDERSKLYNSTTPESERTRVLLELYRKLITKAHE